MKKFLRIATPVVTGLASAWLTDQVMQKTALPRAARPVVSLVAGALIAQAAQRLL